MALVEHMESFIGVNREYSFYVTLDNANNNVRGLRIQNNGDRLCRYRILTLDTQAELATYTAQAGENRSWAIPANAGLNYDTGYGTELMVL